MNVAKKNRVMACVDLAMQALETRRYAEEALEARNVAYEEESVAVMAILRGVCFDDPNGKFDDGERLVESYERIQAASFAYKEAKQRASTKEKIAQSKLRTAAVVQDESE